VWKYWLDSKASFVPVRCEIWRLDGRLVSRMDLEWETEDGIAWFIVKSTREDNTFSAEGLEATSLKMVAFEEFHPNAAISDAVFTLEGLGVPKGTWVLDDRFRPALRTRWLTPPLSVVDIDEIVAETEQVRFQMTHPGASAKIGGATKGTSESVVARVDVPAAATALPDRSSRKAFYAVGGCLGGAVLVMAVAWLTRASVSISKTRRQK
jgi:hypothetical protein